MTLGRLTTGLKLSQCAASCSSKGVARSSLIATQSSSQSPSLTRRRTSDKTSPFSTSSSLRAARRVEEPYEAPRGRLPPLARMDEGLYAAVRPQPLSTLSALASRLRLIPLEADEATRQRRIGLLVQACTHPSFGEMVKRAKEAHGDDFMDHMQVQQRGSSELSSAREAGGEGEGEGEGAGVGEGNETVDVQEQRSHFQKQLVTYPAGLDNAAMSVVGNSLLGMIAAEHLHLRFPNLPTRVLKAAVSAHVGPNTLVDVATELGLGGQGVMRWDQRARIAKEQVDEDGKRYMIVEKEQKLMSRDVLVEAMRSIVALVFQEQGLEVARSFVRNHFLTRMVSMAPLLKFNDPKKTLSETCKKYAKERPQSRLIAETGRLSINPIFVVGVWSGKDKLGEGTGSRIKMAEYRAAEDALRRFYLSETPANELSLPSQTLDDEFSAQLDIDKRAGPQDIWKLGRSTATGTPAEEFRPSRIGHSEVVFGSRG